MVKTIKIGNNSYDMKSSAFTPFKYKNDFGNDLLKDINKINKINKRIEKMPEDEREDEWLDHIGEVQQILYQIAYVMIHENNENFMSYEEWLKTLENVYQDATWQTEVMALAMSTFPGQVEHNKQIK